MDPISLIWISIIAFIVAVIATIVGSAGLIMVPTLVFFGLPLQTAIGTNWFADSMMCLTSSIKFHKDKHLRIKQILPFSIIGGLFGILGIMILLNINEQILSKIISIIVISMVVFILFKNKLGLNEKHKKSNTLLIVLAAVILGIYGGFFGGGLGSLLIISFIFLFGFDMITSVANARISEFIMSITIVIGFIVSGLIDYEVLIPYTIASGIGGWCGASIASKIGNVWIKRIFVVTTIILGIKLWVG